MASQLNGSTSAAPVTDPAASVAEHAETALVIASILEGLVLGVWLAGFPGWALRVGGFPPGAAFFVRWAGVLHIALAVGYALDWLRFRRTALIVIAKGATAAFLVFAWIGDGLPPLMIFAVVLESATAVAAALLHRPAQRSRITRARLRLVPAARSAIRPASRS